MIKSRAQLGLDMEDRVADLMRSRGNLVEKQKIQAPFDLLIGTQRVDVKMSALIRSAIGSKNHYCFRMQSGNRAHKKDLHMEIDLFYLVFDGTGDVFSIESSKVPKFQFTLNIPRNLSRSKYWDDMKFVGNVNDYSRLNPVMDVHMVTGNWAKKLSREQVIEIRSLQGERMAKEVSEEYKLNIDTVRKIWRRLIWKHV